MFQRSFSINYTEDTLLVGNLKDNENERNGFGMTLKNALNSLLSEHQTGILITGSKAFALMHFDYKFYFADSHACGPKEAQTKGSSSKNCKACFIECDTIEEFHRICKRPTGSHNRQFTINWVDVILITDVANVPNENQNHVRITNNTVIEDIIISGIINVPDVNQNQVIETNNKIVPDIIEVYLHVQTSVMLPIDSAQKDVLDEMEVSSDLNKIKRKTTNNIVSEANELKAEEFAWFYLFPYGINGYKEKRPVEITALDYYYQYRIFGNDRRFQRNDYLFYALSMFEYYRVKANISVCCKKNLGPSR